MMANHCNNRLCDRADISLFSPRFPTVDIHEYFVDSGKKFRIYGVQHLDCENFSTPDDLFEHMDGLERYITRRFELWEAAIYHGHIPALLPVSWIYVHLSGLPSQALLQRFTKLCSANLGTDTIFESKYSRLAILMTVACGQKPYVVTIKSTVEGFEEKIKLNDWLRNDGDVGKFQRNIVHIKQRYEITAYFSEVLGNAESVSLTADQAFQLLSEKIMSFDRNCDNGDNSNTWEAYLCNIGDELFDFVKFHANYNSWIMREMGGNQFQLIHSEGTKNYNKARQLMNVEARKHINWVNKAADIEDPVMRQCCMKKPPKHLPPMYLFLDTRKSRKAADPATLFTFDQTGAAMLLESQWLVSTFDVCGVKFNLGENRMVFDVGSSATFRVNSRLRGMFDLYVDLKMLLDCCKPDRDIVRQIYELFVGSSCRSYIFSQLTEKYQLVELQQQFSAHEFDLTVLQETTDRRPKIATVDEDLRRIQAAVSSVIIMSRDVKTKRGKKQYYIPVPYTIAELRRDIQACLAKSYLQGSTRVYVLNDYNTRILKNRGVKGPYPSFITRHHDVLGKLIYVLLPDGTLRFCIESQDPDTLSSQRLTHSQIAGLGPVLDAGEMFLRREAQPDGSAKWIIFKINNSSGHYQPRPSDGLQGVEYLLRKMLSGNPNFDIMRPRCSLVNALSTTRLSVVDISNSGGVSGVVVDETTQVLGSNM